MKDRNILCEYYVRAGICDLGKICYIDKEMVHCSKYKKDKNRKPFRVNKRKEKLNKIKRRDIEW